MSARPGPDPGALHHGNRLFPVVTVTPALLASAIELLPDSVVVVHQEHRSSSDRTSGLEPLLTYAPRADVVALLTPTVAERLRDQLGPVAPEIVVMPNPLPLGFTPRSRLDNPLIVAAGRLVPEKQFGKLVQAFEQIADRIPDWRLRIYGEGPQRQELVRQIRKSNLWDRVELPGSTSDMPGAWAAASVSALTSRAEGFPLVVQEAMAAGVPVASFDCASGPREIIEHEVNGLLVGPESVAGMASALLRLTTDNDLRRRLGEGAVRSSRQYDAHALAERWLGIFADARARRAGRGRRHHPGCGPAGAPGLGRRVRPPGYRRVARHPGSRGPGARGHRADGGTRGVPRRARRRRLPGVPLAARSRRARVARAARRHPRAGCRPAPGDDLACLRGALAGGRRATQPARPGVHGRRGVLGGDRHRRPRLAAPQPLRAAHPARCGDRRHRGRGRHRAHAAADGAPDHQRVPLSPAP